MLEKRTLSLQIEQLLDVIGIARAGLGDGEANVRPLLLVLLELLRTIALASLNNYIK